jgi:predicted nucleic acid-binding protein
VLISAALLGGSINAKALNHALNIGRMVISDPVLAEFSGVIFRKKFDKYFLNDEERHEAVTSLQSMR